MSDDDPMMRWGKARPDPGSGTAWHPLPFHSLDVAACLEALLAVNPRLEALLARLLGLAAADCRAVLSAVAALHDLGKFTTCFQAKGPPEAAPAAAARDRDSGDLDPGHPHSGAWLWRREAKRWIEPGSALLDALVVAANGHHGVPADDKRGSHRVWLVGDVEAARRFTVVVYDLFGLPERLTGAPEEADGKALWLVAGLVNLADWVGSDQRHFPYRLGEASDGSLEGVPRGYWQEVARPVAAEAISAKGLRPSRPADGFSLAALLGEGARPTPLQDWAQQVSLAAEPPGPRLALIEDFTGAGKTEAALILAQRLMAEGCAGPGLYWALPTQATSNALHGRLASSYRRLFAGGAPSLALAHADRDLHLAFRSSLRMADAGQPDYGDGETPAEAACAAWVVDDRRTTFFAEVAVGTVDQALLGIMPSRFNVLRLLGLSQRVLVVDEVHGYDTYTNALVSRLLEFQAALGGSAILLSATLATRERRKLVEAFRRGLGGGGSLPEEPGFPYAALIGRETLEERRLPPGRGTRWDLPVRRLDGAEAAEVALAETARAGGCAAYVRNTVDDAVESCLRLRTAYPDLRVELFHARLALADRQAREAQVLARYGKDSDREERAGRILVATQVIEQSLDLDVDLLASDLAPLDLLIQRAGRLQRHLRAWRPHAPCLLLVGPEPGESAAATWYTAVLPRATKVYPNHARLWATARLLEDAGGLRLESENPRDLLDRVLEWPEAEIPAGLQRSLREMEAAIGPVRSAMALNCALQVGAGYGPGQPVGWEDERHLATRYSELENRTIRLARLQDGRLRPWAEAEDRRAHV